MISLASSIEYFLEFTPKFPRYSFNRLPTLILLKYTKLGPTNSLKTYKLRCFHPKISYLMEFPASYHTLKNENSVQKYLAYE